MSNFGQVFIQLFSGLANIVPSLKGWVDHLFSYGDVFVGKYSKWLVGIVGVMALSHVFRLHINKK